MNFEAVVIERPPGTLAVRIQRPFGPLAPTSDPVVGRDVVDSSGFGVTADGTAYFRAHGGADEGEQAVLGVSPSGSVTLTVNRAVEGMDMLRAPGMFRQLAERPRAVTISVTRAGKARQLPERPREPAAPAVAGKAKQIPERTAPISPRRAVAGTVSQQLLDRPLRERLRRPRERAASARATHRPAPTASILKPPTRRPRKRRR